METLHGKQALVVGGSRGFGRGIVEALLDAGAHVHTIARTPAALATLRVDLGDGVAVAAADAADPVVAGQLLDAVRPDVLVLNSTASSPCCETMRCCACRPMYSGIVDGPPSGSFSPGRGRRQAMGHRASCPSRRTGSLPSPSTCGPDAPEWRAHALWLPTLQDDAIAVLTGFIDPRLFAAFDLPDVLPLDSAANPTSLT